MNIVIIKGRITKDIDVKATNSGVNYCNFSVAVDRRFKDSNGNKLTDFLNVVAWRNTADFVGKYFAKGSEILIAGELQTRSYQDANGNNRTVTEIIANEVDFCGSKASGTNKGNNTSITSDDEDDGIPFEI